MVFTLYSSSVLFLLLLLILLLLLRLFFHLLFFSLIFLFFLFFILLNFFFFFQTFPQPSTVKALLEFLGVINFYHSFLPNIAVTLSPLYAALKSSKPQQELEWSQEMKQALLNGKTALANAAMLVHLCTDCYLALTSNTSDVAVGTFLKQFNKSHRQPLAFFSGQLQKAEIKYVLLVENYLEYI